MCVYIVYTYSPQVLKSSKNHRPRIKHRMRPLQPADYRLSVTIDDRASWHGVRNPVPLFVYVFTDIFKYLETW